jgi:hypothetical protein
MHEGLSSLSVVVNFSLTNGKSESLILPSNVCPDNV